MTCRRDEPLARTGMDASSLIARIDQLLRSGAPPSDRVLEKVATILERARGARDADQDSLTATARSTSSVASTAFTASSRPRSAATSTVADVAAAADTDEDPLGFMSLQLEGKGDAKLERYLSAHLTRNIKKPVDVREQKTRQLQALLDGSGGKYVHADYIENGATQIGGCTSMTPSMTAGKPSGQLGAVASKLAAQGPPRVRNLPSDFRVA